MFVKMNGELIELQKTGLSYSFTFFYEGERYMADQYRKGVFFVRRWASKSRSASLAVVKKNVVHLLTAEEAKAHLAKRPPCKRCDGTGKVWQHGNVLNGVCFKCNGKGKTW